MRSCLYAGEVMHRRRRPVEHEFRYPATIFLLDLDELPELDRTLRLFSWNRKNVVSYFDRDHLDGGGSTKDGIVRFVGSHGIDLAGGRVLVAAQCRIFHYVFNPVSFHWCHDRSGELRAVVAEVNSTFGERHLYLLDDTVRRAASDGTRRYETRKVLHVSPFISMDARYRFHFDPVGERLSVVIQEDEQGEPLLDTSIVGRRIELSDRTLLWMLARFPFQTLRITAAIHWQALKLWRKGVQFHRQPAPTPEMVAQQHRMRSLAEADPRGLRP